MIDFAYQSGDSLIHRLSPKVKLPFLVLFIALVLCTKDLLGTVTACVLILSLMLLSGLPFMSVFRTLRRLLPFLVLIFLMNALFISGNRCLFSLGPLCISKTGIAAGYNIVLHMLAVTLLSVIFIRTTTSVGIMKSMEFYLRPLRIIGVPTRDLALIMSIALQFIPVFFADIDRIRRAQIARGADFSSGSLTDRIRGVLPLIIPAFISAFRRADDLALAIEARGFQSETEEKQDR